LGEIRALVGVDVEDVAFWKVFFDGFEVVDDGVLNGIGGVRGFWGELDLYVSSTFGDDEAGFNEPGC